MLDQSLKDMCHQNCGDNMLPEWGPGARWLVADLGHVLSRIGCRGGTVLGGEGAWAPPASQGLRTFVTPKVGFQLATLFH